MACRYQGQLAPCLPTAAQMKPRNFVTEHFDCRQLSFGGDGEFFITFTAIELQNVQWAMSIIRMWAVKWPSMQLKIFISRILGWPYSNILRNHYTWIASNFSENSLNWMRLTCICVCACVWIMNWKQSGGTCLPITPLNYTVCTHIRFELPARFTNRTITMLYHFAVHTLFCAA